MTTKRSTAVFRIASPLRVRPGRKRHALAVGLLTVSVLGISGEALSCGWWGDGESDADGEAVVIGRGGKAQGGTAAENTPEAMTRRANGLRRYGPSGYAGAVRLYRLAADEGYAPAMNNLGAVYEEGLGVPIDLAAAIKWYRRAADLGEPHAQHSLGMMLIEGRGVASDTTAGLEWVEQAARQGHASACADLGRFYASGEVFGKDVAKALRWWQEAERLGYPEAAEALAALRFMRKNRRP